MLTTVNSESSRTTKMPLTSLALQDIDADDEIGTLKVDLHPNDLNRNKILASLSADEIEFILPHLQLCDLSFNQNLYEFGDKLSHVYFPATAVVSLLYVLADGSVTEINVVGNEGLLGISVLAGESAPGTAVVQCAGEAYRLKASVLKEAHARGNKLPQLLMRYAHLLFVQTAQNTVCARHYSIDQQLSRWLLEHLDRLSGNVLKVTQEFVANMLGVRRESVTEAAGKLQSEGLIQNKRGNIIVLDRKGLESYAGECYSVAKHEMDQMLTGA